MVLRQTLEVRAVMHLGELVERFLKLALGIFGVPGLENHPAQIVGVRPFDGQRR